MKALRLFLYRGFFFLDLSWKEDTQLGRKWICDEAPNDEHTPCLLNWKDLIRFHKFFTIHRLLDIYTLARSCSVCVKQLGAVTKRKVWWIYQNQSGKAFHPILLHTERFLFSWIRFFPLHFEEKKSFPKQEELVFSPFFCLHLLSKIFQRWQKAGIRCIRIAGILTSESGRYPIKMAPALTPHRRVLQLCTTLTSFPSSKIK